MSITIPTYLSPVLWYYGLQHYWPGIDEDAVVEWGDEAVAWIEVTETFTKELVTLLGEIGENTETEVFEAIRDTFDSKKKEDFDPWLDMIKVGIPTTTSGIRVIATGVKSGILGILIGNVASDIPLIMSGVGLAVVALKKAAMKALLDVLLSEVLEVAVAELTELATKYVETYWLNAQKEELQKAIANELASLVATGVSDGGGGSATPVLDANTVDVANCISKLGIAVHNFQDATKNAGMAAIDESRISDDAIIGCDRLIRIAVAELLEWGVGQLQDFAINLAMALLDSLSEMLLHADRTLTDAEERCQVEAEELRMTLQTLRPVGMPSSSQGPPDFFAPVRASIGTGTAGSDVGPSQKLDEPVRDAKGTGTARAQSQDVSVLDAPVNGEDGVGAANANTGGGQPDLGSVSSERGVGTANSDAGNDQPDLESEVSPV